MGPGIDHNAAWVLVRLRRNPADMPYAAARGGAPGSRRPGVYFDDWRLLSAQEKSRRAAWLERYGASPFRLLRVETEALSRAGVHVTDWGPPTDASGSVETEV